MTPYALLYVADPEISASFFGALFDREPIDSSATFALFALDGMMLGLWRRSGVEPKAEAEIGGSEVAFRVESEEAVQRLGDRLAELGAVILQAPTRLDFGYAVTGATSDGHRIRVFSRSVA
ncbi:VOC family protein [Aurantimonas sp. VKM B-3413]|uniref:VOC family protein n=1 Tax=Aurantimonas sp. VKM B-3413 TaxID=2779401 RepID=UPI001E5C7171|nr:VOC family protein [Aurantimonas sp. VKM B-3413]MCB8840748.1 VOC family protein [Aurantimonas sp. VKM B-3413]